MKAGPIDRFEQMRLEAELRKLAEIETQFAEMTERVDKIDASLGDPERLQEAIAPVLSGALRDAGVEGHEAVASAMAPYVIDTVRVEIFNSQDELIEVVQPKIGVMIRATVADAIEELSRKVDEALPIDRWIAAGKARLTGVSSVGFIVREARPFHVKDALLIERSSGVLLARQPFESAEAAPEEGDLDKDLLAGMIAALQGFADDAYGPSGAGDLQRFSFTEDTVYLRASPTKILAVRCGGVAPPDIETRIGLLLERALGQSIADDGDGDGVLKLEDLESETAPKSDVSASKIAAGIVGVAIGSATALWGHGAVVGSHTARWVASVDEAVRSDAAIRPYPLSVALSENGEQIDVTGLVADDESLVALERRVDWAASPLETIVDVAVVSTSDQ